MEIYWTTKEAKKPSSRKGHMAVRVPGQIILFGGEDVLTENTDDTVENTTVKMFSMRVIWMYHLDIDRWTKTVLPEAHVVPPATAYACAVMIGSQIYLHGGLPVESKTKATGALWKLTNAAEGISWSKMKFQDKKSMPSPRCLHAAWEYKNKLWIFGGVGPDPKNYLFKIDGIDESDGDDDNNDGKVGNDIFVNARLACYNPNSHEWKSLLQFGAIPCPRLSHAVTKIKDHIWLYGGAFDRFRCYDDLYELNMESLTWILIEPTSKLTYSFRVGHSLTAISDHEIALYGGSSITNDTSLWLLDTQTLSWKQCDTFLSDYKDDYGRERHTATMGTESLIIFGGDSYISENKSPCTIDMIQWALTPNSMVKSAMESAYENRSASQREWKTLPRHLHRQLCAMSEIDGADDKNVGNEEDCDVPVSTDVNDTADHMIWKVMKETFMTYARREMIVLMSMMI